LPREAAPSDFVWQRIVRELREDGTLRRIEAGGRRVRPWLVAAVSMAASLVLFGSGAMMGHWLGARSTERAFLAAREQDAAQLAQRVQEAGSAYVAALVALGELRAAAVPGNGRGVSAPPTQADSEIGQGREAALGALYGAAFELARMTPGDPDVAGILQILEQRRHQGTGAGTGQTTVWY
ncbi:MAG: hypothetical protein V2B17_06870, partial [Chloroflexota bacterium]